jgi:hypothetical protein
LKADAARQAFDAVPTTPSATRAHLDGDAKVTMVNGSFLLLRDWEKLAGQTWSTRPFCRAANTPPYHKNPYRIGISGFGTTFADRSSEPHGLGELHAV